MLEFSEALMLVETFYTNSTTEINIYKVDNLVTIEIRGSGRGEGRFAS